MKCANCEKDGIDEGFDFCHCGSPSHPELTKPNGQMNKKLRSLAGITTIISACLALVLGLLGLWSFMFFRVDGSSFPIVGLLGFFNVLGFIFGLTSGVLSIIRKHFTASIFGVGWLIALGALLSFMGSLWMFGVPILFLATLSVVLVVLSREDFSKN